MLVSQNSSVHLAYFQTEMPFPTNEDLPDRVKDHLPAHAQDIYREAFNHAYDEYEDPNKRKTDDSREVVAHKVAWAAVGKKYEKDEDGEWVKK
jgi:cation transport regulator